MKTLNTLIIAIVCSALVSCELFEEGATGLSTDEVVEGLKTALNVGTDSSTSALAVVNGYLGDELVKIPLPPEIETIKQKIENLKKKKSTTALGDIFSEYVSDAMFDNLQKGINRAAESAASEAGPVFGDAISDMSISDAWDILNGTNPADGKKSEGFDSTAATNYFKSTTKPALIDIYAPKIDFYLDKDFIPGLTPNEAFFELKDAYNGAYNIAKLVPGATLILQSEGLTLITTSSIGEFSTNLALDGLFRKVGQEEIKIRRNPWEYLSKAVDAAAEAIGEILVKVFGEKE